MALNKWGVFATANGAKNTAVVDGWLETRFATVPPPFGSDPPDEDPPDAPGVTTDDQNGCPGAYWIELPSVADYWIRIQYADMTLWQHCPAGSIGGQ